MSKMAIRFPDEMDQPASGLLEATLKMPATDSLEDRNDVAVDDQIAHIIVGDIHPAEVILSYEDFEAYLNIESGFEVPVARPQPTVAGPSHEATCDSPQWKRRAPPACAPPPVPIVKKLCDDHILVDLGAKVVISIAEYNSLNELERRNGCRNSAIVTMHYRRCLSRTETRTVWTNVHSDQVPRDHHPGAPVFRTYGVSRPTHDSGVQEGPSDEHNAADYVAPVSVETEGSRRSDVDSQTQRCGTT